LATKDVINIETQLGYTYGPGSLDRYAAAQGGAMLAAMTPLAEGAARTVHVGGLDRGKIRGSFIIAAYAEVNGQKRLVDLEPVLSRWHVAGCANCQTHLEATADFRLPASMVEKGVEVQVHTRSGVLGRRGARMRSAGLVKSLAAAAPPLFSVEIL
jgi:tyrosinase